MKLWIDDLRTPVEDGWVVARTPGDAVAALESCVASGEVLEWVVYDHDLGLDGNGLGYVPGPGFSRVIEECASREDSGAVLAPDEVRRIAVRHGL